MIANAARARAEELNISLDRLTSLGTKLIRRDDVDRLALGQSAVYMPSRRQRMVAAVVTRAHDTIPTASAVMKINADEALNVANNSPSALAS